MPRANLFSRRVRILMADLFTVEREVDRSPAALRLIYSANIFLVGFIGGVCLVFPDLAANWIFAGTTQTSYLIRTCGAFWCALAVLSVPALFFPFRFSPLLLFQLLANLLWLLAVAVPAIFLGTSNQIPMGLAVFLLTWLIVLPMVIPFDHLFDED